MSISPDQSENVQPSALPMTIVGPDGEPISSTEQDQDTEVESLVQSPAKVMRIGSMIKQLLDEVKSAPLDESARVRLREIHLQSRNWRTRWRRSWSRSSSDSASRSTIRRRARLNCGLPKRSWWAGLRDCSTGFRQPCTHSR